MESDNIDTAPPGRAPGTAGPPSASAWLWRPWFAKLWWTAAALYWAGRLGSYWSETLDAIYSTALAGLLNVFFFPPTIAMVLGSGLVRAWMDYKGFEWGPATTDQLFPKHSVGGWRDPYTDSIDPKSGMIHWRHFHSDR